VQLAAFCCESSVAVRSIIRMSSSADRPHNVRLFSASSSSPSDDSDSDVDAAAPVLPSHTVVKCRGLPAPASGRKLPAIAAKILSTAAEPRPTAASVEEAVSELRLIGYDDGDDLLEMQDVATHAPAPVPPPRVSKLARPTAASVEQAVGELELAGDASLLATGFDGSILSRTATTTASTKVEDYVRRRQRSTPLSSVITRVTTTALAKAAEAEEGFAAAEEGFAGFARRALPPPPPLPPPVSNFEPAVYHQQTPTAQHQFHSSSSMLSAIRSDSGLPLRQESTGTTRGRQMEMRGPAGPPPMFSVTARMAATASSKTAEAEESIAARGPAPPPPPLQIGGRGPAAVPKAALAKRAVRMRLGGAVKESEPPTVPTLIERESTGDDVYECSAPISLAAQYHAITPTAAYSASARSSTSVDTEVDKVVEHEISSMRINSAARGERSLFTDLSADFDSVRPLDGSTDTVPRRAEYFSSHHFNAFPAFAGLDRRAEFSASMMRKPSPPASLERAEAICGKELESAYAAVDKSQHPIAFGASDGAAQVMFGSALSSEDEVLALSGKFLAAESPQQTARMPQTSVVATSSAPVMKGTDESGFMFGLAFPSSAFSSEYEVLESSAEFLAAESLQQTARMPQTSVVAWSSAPVMKGTDESGFIGHAGPPILLASSKKDAHVLPRLPVKKRKSTLDQTTESEGVPTPDDVAVLSGESSADVVPILPAELTAPSRRSVVADSSASETMAESLLSFGIPPHVMSSYSASEPRLQWDRARFPVVRGGGPSKEQKPLVTSARDEEQDNDTVESADGGISSRVMPSYSAREPRSQWHRARFPVVRGGGPSKEQKPLVTSARDEEQDNDTVESAYSISSCFMQSYSAREPRPQLDRARFPVVRGGGRIEEQEPLVTSAHEEKQDTDIPIPPRHDVEASLYYQRQYLFLTLVISCAKII